MSISLETLRHIGSFIHPHVTRCGTVYDYLIGALDHDWSDTILINRSEKDYDNRNVEYDGTILAYKNQTLWIESMVPINKQSCIFEAAVRINFNYILALMKRALQHKFIHLEIDACNENGKWNAEHAMIIVPISDNEIVIVDSYIRERSFTIRPFSLIRVKEFIENPNGETWSKFCCCQESNEQYIEWRIQIGWPKR